MVAASAAPSIAGKKSKRGDYAVAAVLSGMMTKTACAPLDRIRLLYQVQGMFAGGETVKAKTRLSTGPEAAAALNHCKYQSMTHTARTIFTEEGLSGFWRGNGVNVGRAMLVYLLKFGANDYLKEKALRKKRRKSEQKTNSTEGSKNIVDGSDQKVQLGIFSLMKAGGVAGLLQKTISFPLDLLSVRVAMGVNTSALSDQPYAGFVDAVRRTKAREGLTGFYKGFGPTLLTGVPYVMLQMTFFEYYRRSLEASLSGLFTASSGSTSNLESSDPGSLAARSQKGWKEVFVTSTIAGAAAGVTAQGFVFPGDTIRKRMMANGVDGRQRLYNNSWDCARKIYVREGWRAYYSGMVPMICRALPSGAIQFGCYEMCKHAIRWLRNESADDSAM